MQQDRQRPSLPISFFPNWNSIALLTAILAAPAANAVDVHYVYDALGRLTTVTIGDASLTYQFDAMGNRQLVDATASVDSDNDGTVDAIDNCPNTSNADQANNDGDANGDLCDADDDNDGVADDDDALPFDPSETTDNDGDGIGDNADTDDDNDGADDVYDNCPLHSNPDQLDSDYDYIGDVCDDHHFCLPCLPTSRGWRALIN